LEPKGVKCKFCALLDPSANIKVKEHLKPNIFHIAGFTSGIVEFGPICKKAPHALHMSKSEIQCIGPTLELYISGFLRIFVAELPELFQLKCLSPALEARPHFEST
jgi:hypothetical protein